jgi:serine/threonine protein kinase
MNEKILRASFESEIVSKSYDRLVNEHIQKIKNEGHSIGEGRTAEVKKIGAHEELCLKIIHSKDFKGKKSVYRAHKEMKFLELAKQNQLPVPTPVYALETDEENDYLFMETIKGMSCKDLVEKDLINELPDSFNFRTFFAGIRNTLEKMHDKKIYHRDLHWGNIMIDINGNHVIIDFGDAKVKDLESEDPYKETDSLGNTHFLERDEDSLSKVYKSVGEYLKDNNYIFNKG